MPAGATADQPGSTPRVFLEPEFRHLLALEVQRCIRYQDFLSVCLIRTTRHADVALHIAEMLRSTDFVGAVGTDVAVLLVHTPEADAVIIADRIRERVLSITSPGSTDSAQLGMSIGLASFPTDATIDSALLARALATLSEPA